MNNLMRELQKSYSPNNVNFAQETMKVIDDYWAQLTPDAEAKDPKRLGTKSVFVSKLKSAIINDLKPLKIGNAIFDAMSLKNQQLFKLMSLKTNQNDFIHSVDIIPKNLEGLNLSMKESKELKKLRSTIDNAKLKEAPIEFDGQALLNKLMPLLNGKNLYKEVVPALLLATGRRSVEILKTGDFILADDMSPKGYTCIFTGQAKSGIEEMDGYEIPLLAPYWMVKKALETVRQSFDATNLSTEEVHQVFARQLNTFVKKLAGTTPHMLRSIYAMMCYQMNKKKASMIGFISSILGHSQLQNAGYYQRVLINNITGPYKPTENDIAHLIPETKTDENDGWIFNNKPEQKRIEGIKQMMASKMKITASSIRTHAGGSMLVIQRIIRNNQKLIDDYNATLEQ